jgi:hypothetical protein
VNFFSMLAAELRGPLNTLKQEELNVIGPVLGNVVPALLSNPTKGGLIAAAAPAVVQIAAAQPGLIAELITDLVAAVAHIETPVAVPAPATVVSPTPVPTSADPLAALKAATA